MYNTLRDIIGGVKGILLFIILILGNLRTPKKIRFNELIKFLNLKYSLEIPESLLDSTDFKKIVGLQVLLKQMAVLV